MQYGSNQCWLCLCEVCTRVKCRKLNRRYSHDFCISMLIRERCPVMKCEDFQHREKHRVYRVRRRRRRADQLAGQLVQLREMLAKLLEKE